VTWYSLSLAEETRGENGALCSKYTVMGGNHGRGLNKG